MLLPSEGELNAEKRNNVFEKPYAPVGMAKITKTDSTKCWQALGVAGASNGPIPVVQCLQPPPACGPKDAPLGTHLTS